MNHFSVTGFENKCSVMLTLGKFEAQISDLALVLSHEMLRLVIGGKRCIKSLAFPDTKFYGYVIRCVSVIDVLWWIIL